MTLNEIYNGIIADIESEMGVKVPAFGKSFLRVIAIVQAAKLYIYYKSLEFIERNTLPDTADPASKGGTLQRWGRVILNRFQFSATQAQYEIEVSGSIGATIESGTTFQSKSNATSPNQLYILDAKVELTTDPETIIVRALSAGRIATLEVGDGLILTAPISGIDKNATVTDTVTEPVDGESDEQYRERTLEAIRTEPQGGAAVDYRIWANEVDGVAQSYPYAAIGVNNAGAVEVYVQATLAASSDGRGTPTGATLTAVEEAIKLNPDTSLPISQRGRLPLGINLNVYASDIQLVTVSIAGFVDLDAGKEAAIRAGIGKLVNDIRPFVESFETEQDKNDTLTLNAVISAITTASPGSVFGNVNVTVNGGGAITSETFLRDKKPFTNDANITFV